MIKTLTNTDIVNLTPALLRVEAARRKRLLAIFLSISRGDFEIKETILDFESNTHSDTIQSFDTNDLKSIKSPSKTKSLLSPNSLGHTG